MNGESLQAKVIDSGWSNARLITALGDNVYLVRDDELVAIDAETLQPRPPSGTPAIFSSARTLSEYAYLCLYGLPKGLATVVIYDPNDNPWRYENFSVTDEVTDDNGEIVTFHEVPMWWPVGIKTGQWAIKVLTGNNGSIEGNFEIEPVIEPMISIVQTDKIDPFKYCTEESCNSYPVGAKVRVLGEGFTPND